MKHLTWNYRGYDDLGLNFIYEPMQKDWNTTILGMMNEVFGEGFEEGMNIFVSERVIDEILKTIVAYDVHSKIIFNKKIIKLDFDTPKIYITKPEISSFTQIKHNNYGSITIKNFINK